MTLNRRELSGYFLTFGLAVPTVATMATGPSAAAAPGIAANAPGRTVKLHDGTVVVALGQGSARLGQGRHPAAVEEDALREGISLGMTLIDTAEIYGNGEAEKLIGRVIAGIPGFQSVAVSCGRRRNSKSLRREPCAPGDRLS